MSLGADILDPDQNWERQLMTNLIDVKNIKIVNFCKRMYKNQPIFRFVIWIWYHQVNIQNFLIWPSPLVKNDLHSRIISLGDVDT